MLAAAAHLGELRGEFDAPSSELMQLFQFLVSAFRLVAVAATAVDVVISQW